MLKIGELSDISNNSVQTIRYYESIGLISPIEVDKWTKYRYYDESSVERLSEINFLKELGFSLYEIKNLNKNMIEEKLNETKNNIKKLSENIKKLSVIKNKGYIKTFVNDENVIGKWKKLGIVKNKNDLKNNSFIDCNFFDFNELYFLPKGESYWLFGWTKGWLYYCEKQLPYEICDGKLFINLSNSECYVVYEKIDNKKYKKEELSMKDDTNILFENDEQVIGFWRVVDFVRDFSQFKPNEKFWKESLIINKYIVEPNGSLIIEYNNGHISKQSWSRGVFINKNDSTVSKYTIKRFNEEEYIFMEWKSGDYIFSGKIKGYYVFKRNK